MEILPDNHILKLNPNLLVRTRKKYGFYTTEDMDKAIDSFDDWVKKQNHFVKKDFSRDYLERGIITSKGSVELAKSRMDKLCTMRTLIPHFFEDYDFEKDFKFSNVTYVLLPNLTKGHSRVLWYKVGCDQFTSSSILNLFRTAFVVILTEKRIIKKYVWHSGTAAIAEYIRLRDYVGSFTLVHDLRGMNLADFLMNLQINHSHQLLTILLNGYAASVDGLHYLTSSKLIDRGMSILRPMLSSKINQRIKVHKDVESLYEFLPKEILPVEYGGEEKPLEELCADFVKELSSKEFKEYWMEMCGARTDESLRRTDKFNEEYMGMPGSFRTLSVD